MGVPEEIRNIPRPKNTVVVRSGRGFRIREHIGCKNEKGRRIPIFGNYIGSIIDGVYVPDDPVPWTGAGSISNITEKLCSAGS